MPRLPSSGDVSRVNPRIATDPGVQAPAQAFDTGLGTAAQEFAPVVNALAKAKQRVDERRATIDRFRQRRLFKEQANKVSDGLLARGEVLSDEELDSLKAQIDQFESNAITSHTGGELSRFQLQEELASERSTISGRVGAENIKRSRALAEEEVGKDINEIAVEVARNPSMFDEGVQRAKDLIDSTGNIFDQAKKDDMKTAAISLFTESVIDTHLAVGDVEQAIELIENPRIQELMDEKSISRVLKSINRAEQARESDIKGIPRDVFNTLSPQEQKRAIGALPRSPLVTISPGASELEKLDAQRVNKLDDEGQQAISDLREVVRMRAAIESGRFTPGVIAGPRLFLARLADFVGADEETRKLIGDAATADTLDAASNRLAVNAAQKLGRITNLSLTFIRDSLPNLTRTPEGNLILLEVMERSSERAIEVAGIADDFIQKHGTLRPQGAPSFFQKVRDLEEERPVITEELKKRITEGSRSAPSSFREVLGGVSDKIKGTKGLQAPDGFEIVSVEGDKVMLKNIASGETRIGPKSSLKVKEKDNNGKKE